MAALVLALVAAVLFLPGLLSPPAFTLTGSVAVGQNPAEVRVAPDGTRAYVTSTDNNTLQVIDTEEDQPFEGPADGTP